jgi:type I restriction enzyme, R subunit
MTPEEKARQDIDKLLIQAGWDVQDRSRLNLGAKLGVAIREFPTQKGPADYMLFVDRKAVGVVEAKPTGTTLSGVAEQSGKYIASTDADLPKVDVHLPFAYESTGAETFFRDERDPQPRSRRLFAFHKPETIQEWLQEEETLRKRLQNYPELSVYGLRGCQIEAIGNLEASLAKDDPRALLQMATGSGKTFTAVSFIYRLLKFGKAKRVLFLVDRGNLGRQTLKEFQKFTIPDDGRKFTELYNVQHLKSPSIDPVSKVCIGTIQRMYSILSGNQDFDASLEEESQFDNAPEFTYEDKVPVEYNPQLPIEAFDFIVTDECHRSIYNLWRQVLEYFDAHLIGLTATPSKQTIGFFNSNLIMEYSHERAVADGINVGYDIYRIKTKIGEEGNTIEQGTFVDVRNRETRKVRWEKLDEKLTYQASQLDRSVVAPDQIRTVIKVFKNWLPDIFPDRETVPKTLIFAKDDNHAEEIVHIVREVFGKGNDFAKKITYRTGEDVEELIQSFRNSYFPRIAVTVDMISTGTDIKPLECLIFMRDVKSRVYFEQMKGRGTRTIGKDDLKAVTPDAEYKNRFVIFDAVGVTDSIKTDSRTLERQPFVSFKKLLEKAALRTIDEDGLASLAGRISKFEQSLNEADKAEISQANNGISLKQVAHELIDVIDPDVASTPEEKERQKHEALKYFDNPDFRQLMLDIKQKNEIVIDLTPDNPLDMPKPEPVQPEELVQGFETFIKENKDEITALQIIFSKPYKKQSLTFQEIKELRDRLLHANIRFTNDQLWHAYRELYKSKVRNAKPDRVLTNIVSLVRFAVDKSQDLEPFPTSVEERYQQWLNDSHSKGMQYSDDQLAWLNMIKNYVAVNGSIQLDGEITSFELPPFSDKGGIYKAHEVFGSLLEPITNELNNYLVI